MSLPTSRQSYGDCYDAFDRALEDTKGIRIRVADWEAAFVLRQRLHYARSIHRKDNLIAYEEGHAMHGASPYYKLACRIRESGNGTYVYIEHVDLDHDAIEALSEVTEESTAPIRPVGDPQALSAVVDSIKRRA